MHNYIRDSKHEKIFLRRYKEMIGDKECIKFPECVGCNKVVEQEWQVTGSMIRTCGIYTVPRAWWRRGSCPIIFKHIEGPEKVRVGQQKGKKKARRLWKDESE